MAQYDHFLWCTKIFLLQLFLIFILYVACNVVIMYKSSYRKWKLSADGPQIFSVLRHCVRIVEVDMMPMLFLFVLTVICGAFLWFPLILFTFGFWGTFSTLVVGRRKQNKIVNIVGRSVNVGVTLFQFLMLFVNDFQLA